MPWYLWVWGAVTTVSCVLWIVVGLGAAGTEWEKWAKQRYLRRDAIESNKSLVDEVDRLKRALKEAQKGHNEYGRISP